MIVKTLLVRDFRNHTSRDFVFEPGINAITGPNASGKTNIVEAVYSELRNAYIGTELLENIRTTLDMWYEAIGYAVALDKNSHVLNEEADFQFSQSTTKVKTWTNMLNIGFDKINKMFGTNMEVEYACENMSSGNAEASGDREQEHKR